MPVQLGDRGQPDFTRPIEMMIDCHRRIESFLAVLERVADRNAGGELYDEASRALRAALHYFQTAAPNHTADEEDSLFPALRALERADLEPLLEQAEELEKQHTRAVALHERVHEVAQRWLESGTLDTRSLEAMRRDLATLRTLYQEHIAFEDGTLFPEAERALGETAVERIGREMAARRGITDAPPKTDLLG